MEAARGPHKWQPRRCASIAGALNPRPNARSALDLRSANQTYQPNLRENSRAARATGRTCLFERRDPMTAHLNRCSIGNATRAPLHVVIIGGGIGGLTLAQGLKKSGVSTAAYDRDRAPTDPEPGSRMRSTP